MSDGNEASGGTVVLGERELAIGFRLIGHRDVVEVTEENAAREFLRVLSEARHSLIVASQSVRRRLTEAQRQHAEASLHPLVVFVPPPSGEYEVESLNALAKRVLGVSLAMPK